MRVYFRSFDTRLPRIIAVDACMTLAPFDKARPENRPDLE